jgi:N-terminal domain of NWD NACHT-NTPase
VQFVVKQFEKHTTALYEKILLYQLRMACHYAQNRLKRYARNAAMRDDWKGMLAEIKRHESNADFDMRAVDSSRIHSLVAGRDDDLRRQILSALSCDYESTKESHPSAVPGTPTSVRTVIPRRANI